MPLITEYKALTTLCTGKIQNNSDRSTFRTLEATNHFVSLGKFTLDSIHKLDKPITFEGKGKTKLRFEPTASRTVGLCLLTSSAPNDH